MAKIVLLVEDYEDTRLFMKFLLEENGYHVFEAGDGLEAVELVHSCVPDIILMDLSIPRMDGLAATKIIRNIEEFAQIPIIAVTAHGSAYSQRALDAGCTEVLNKPLDIGLLESLLSGYFPA